jgi:hypothetical protein
VGIFNINKQFRRNTRLLLGFLFIFSSMLLVWHDASEHLLPGNGADKECQLCRIHSVASGIPAATGPVIALGGYLYDVVASVRYALLDRTVLSPPSRAPPIIQY